jgi:hypothetical protein
MKQCELLLNLVSLKGGVVQIYFYTNRALAVILSYNDTGISEHGIFHGITTYTNI